VCVCACVFVCVFVCVCVFMHMRDIHVDAPMCCSILQHFTVCCSVLQCCSELVCVCS